MPEEDNSLEGNTSSAYSSSLETAAPQVQTVVVQRGPSLMGFNRRAFKITAGAVMAILLIAGAAFAFNSFQSKKADEQAAKKGNYTVSNLSISDVKSNDQLKVGSADSLSVNGRLQVSNTVVLTPTSAPDAPEVGQIYYDKTTNALYYYNGSAFVPVATQNAIVSSLGGLTGAVNTGAGISAVAGSLQNTGVLSVQGQTGNVTFSAGGGISISGTTVSLTALPAGELVLGTGASGFTSVAQASTPGQCLISTSGAPVFGSCTGTTQVTSLNGLINGLTIASGSGISVTDNGSNTITITSTAAAGITSINSQTGPTLTVANATAASNIITINNAAADGSTKGIAAFNTTNFSAASGVINTIQGISTSASPTFANLTTTGYVKTAELRNATDVVFTLPVTGSGTTRTLCYVDDGNTSNCPTGGNVSFGATHTSNKIAALDGSGNLVDSQLSTTVGGLLYSGSAYLLDLSNGTSSTLTVDNSGAGVANLSVSGSVTASGGVVLAAGKTLQAASGGIDISAGTGGSDTLTFYTSNGLNSFILPTSGGLGQTICTTAITCASGGGQAVILEPGASPQSSAAATAAIFINKTLAGTGNLIQLQSNGTDKFVINNKGELNSLIFAAGTAGTDYVTLQSATQSGVVALSVPAVAAGSYNICLDSGNCAGSGGGITGSGSANTIAMFTAGGTIGNSVLTQSTGNLIASGDLTLQGGDLTLGVAGPAGTTGALNFKHSASAFSGTIVQGALTANQTYTLPDGTGDICLSSGNCLGGSGGGASNAAAYLTVGNDATLTGERAITAGTNLSSADGGANSTFTLNVVANPTFTGLVTANGGLTVETGDTFTFNGDAFTDLTGTGLTVSLGALQTTLGTSVDLASEVTGTLAVGNGGTGAASFTSNGVLYGNGSSALGVTAAGTNGQVLLGNTAGAPAFATVSGDATITSAGSVTVSKLQNTTVTFTSLTSGDVLQYNGSAIVNGKITNTNLQAGTFANITGTGALATGSIASGFGTISTGNNITTTTTVQGGTVNATSTLQLGGVDINIAGTLSNVAYLNAASNTFTGASGMIIQGAGGLTLGTSTQIGNLVLNDGNGGQKTTLQAGNSSADLTFILPTAAGGTNQCIKQGGSPNQLVFDDCLGGAGGGPTVTLQQAYTASTGGTTPEIKLDTTRGALDIQDADTTIGTNLLNVRASNGAGLGSVLVGVGNTGLVTLQPSANLVSGESALTQTLTNGSSTGGTVTGFGQSITVSNSVSTSTTIGHNIAVADNGAISNTAYGLNVAMSGSSSGLRIGVNSSTNKGPAIVATSNGSSQLNYTCGDATLSYSLGLCAADMAGSTAGAGIYAQSTSRSSSSINDAAGSALYGVNSSTVAASGGYYYGGVKGLSLRTTNGQAFTTVGVYGEASGGDAATAYGGYFTLTSGTSAVNGAALYASNANTTRDILRLQDSSTTVVQVADNGASLFKNSTDSTTAFQIQSAGGSALFSVDTQSLTVSAGNALATTLNLQTATSGTIGLGNNAVANTIQIGTTSTNTGNTQSINIGNLNVAGTTNVTIGTGASATAGTTTLQSKGTLSLGNAISPTINIQGAASGTIGLGNNAVANTVTIGNQTTTSTTTIQGGSGNININPSGSSNTGLIVKPAADSTAAIRFQNVAGTNLFNLDTTQTNLIINGTFEADTNFTTPANWSNSGFTTMWVNGTAHSGSKGMFVNGSGTATATISAPVANTTYTLTFWANNVSGSTFTVTPTIGGASCTTTPSITGGSGWTSYSCSATTGASPTSTMTMPMSGVLASFDDFTLVAAYSGTATFKDTKFVIQDASASTILTTSVSSHQIAINESAPSQSSATLDVNGNINVTTGNGYMINGASINTGGTLTNVVYKDQNNTLTGNNIFQGTSTFTGSGNGSTTYGALFANTSDSSTALVVRNSNSTNLLSIDTSSIIINSQFESDTSFTLPANWSNSGLTTMWVNGTAHSGSKGMYLNGSGTATGNLSSAPTGSILYTLKFWANNASGSGITFTPTIGGTACSGSITISASAGWNQYSCSATLGASPGTTITLPITSASTSFDDFTLFPGTTVGGTVNIQANLANTGYALFKNTTNSALSFQIQNSSGAALLNADTSNMRLSVGSQGTATAQLYVGGYMPSAALASVSTSSTAWGVAVQGRYAYVATGSTTNGLKIYDISNPASPSLVGTGVTTGGGNKRIKVQGKYAYLAGWESSTVGRFEIWDISNPKTPTQLGTKTYTLNTSSGQPALDVQGRYAYVGDSLTSNLFVFDVSNPVTIPAATAIAISGLSGTGGAYDVAAQGKYAYLSINNGGTGTGVMQILDMSNPNVPVMQDVLLTSELTTYASPGSPYSIAVQGMYVYLGTKNSGVAGYVYVIDVSDPATLGNTQNVARLTLAGGTSVQPQGLSVQGRTLYIADNTNNVIRAVDISVPTSPLNISATSTASVPQSLFAAGRYLYAATSNASSNGLQVFDLGGTYDQQLEVGGIEAETLNLRGRAVIASDASIQGSLSVGGGIQTTGSSSFYSTATTAETLSVSGAQTTANVASFSGSSVSTGNVLAVSSSSAGLTSGGVLQVSQTSSYASAIMLSGNSFNVNRAVTNTGSIITPTQDVTPVTATYSSTSTWNSTSITVGSNTNKVIIAHFTTTGSATVSSITIGGVTATLIRTYSYTTSLGTTLRVYDYYVKMPSSGSQTANISWSSNATGTLALMSYKDVDQTTPIGTVYPGSGATACGSGSPTTCTTGSNITAAAGDLVMADLLADNDWAFGGPVTNLTPGASQTTVVSQNPITNAVTAVSTKTATGTNQTMSWTADFLSAGGIYGYAVKGAYSSITITGAAAQVSSNCTIVSGGCSDSSNVLNLTQSYASASGAVLALQNAGTGLDIQLATGGIDRGTAGAINLGATTATSVNIGNASGATAVSVLCGTGTCGFGNNATAHATTVGSLTTSSVTTIQGGTGTGAITLTPGTAGTIVVGATAGTGSITLGSSSTTQSVLIGNGTGASTVSIANGVATATGNTVNIAGGATATGLTDTVNIATGNSAGTGAKVVHIADGTPAGTGINTVTIGSVTNASISTLQGGTGATAVNVQTGSGGKVNIATSGVANSVQIGNTTGGVAQTIAIGNNATASSTSTVTIGNLLTTSTTTIQGGTGAGGIALTAAGSSSTGIIAKTTTDSSAAFQIQNAAGTSNLFVANSLNTRIGIARAATTYTLEVSGVIWASTGLYADDGSNISKLLPNDLQFNTTGTSHITQLGSGGSLDFNTKNAGGSSTTRLTIGSGDSASVAFTDGAYSFKSASGNSATAFQVQDNSSNAMFILSTLNYSGGYNAANATLKVAQDSGTSRSINAAGSINASGADYAEWIPWFAAKPSQGTIVEFHGSSMVVSSQTTAAFIGNDAIADQTNAILVAFAGQVPVKISGSVNAGDYLVPNGDGTARGVSPSLATLTDYFAKVGTALESGSGSTVLALVNGPGASAQFNPQANNASFGDINVAGTATIQTLVVTGSATFHGNIIVDGHVITSGSTPDAQVLSAAGAGATITVDGNDTSGTITITIGSGATAGDLGKLIFNQAFGKVPKTILSAQDEASQNALIFPSGKTTSEFKLHSSQALSAGTYTFDYFIVQ